MVTAVAAFTALVVIVKVLVVVPAATVTEAGTVAALRLLLASVTTAPPAGAAALSVTVPVLFAPPVRLPGFTVIEASAADQYRRVQRQGTQQRVHDEPDSLGDAIVSGGDD